MLDLARKFDARLHGDFLLRTFDSSNDEVACAHRQAARGFNLGASRIVFARLAHLLQNPCVFGNTGPRKDLAATSAEIFSTGKGASKIIT